MVEEGEKGTPMFPFQRFRVLPQPLTPLCGVEEGCGEEEAGAF